MTMRVAVIKRDNVTVYNRAKEIITKIKFHIDWDITRSRKEGYEHFMLKGNYGAAKAVHNTISSRLVDGKIVFG